MHRCYLPPAHWSDSGARVEGEEAAHALKVMRLKPGDICELFDGEGRAAQARVTHVAGKHAMELEWVSLSTEQAQAYEARVAALAALPPLTLALAIPKGGNMELIVQKAVELGASRICPLMTERTIVRLKAKEAEAKREKWQRVALEACKQCGVNRVPQVEAVGRLEDFLQQVEATMLRLCCSLEADARPMGTLRAEAGAETQGSALLIGPEGDFSPSEYAQIREAGFLPASLGPIVLRVETAVFKALSLCAGC